MGKFVDLTGRRFGRLTVIRRANEPGKERSPTWLCRCDCGNTKVVLGQSLRNGITVSCGCWRRENATGNLFRMHKDAKVGLVAGTNISKIKSASMYSNNTTGHTGVYPRPMANGRIRYRAFYQLQGKPHILGTYDTIEEAARVHDEAVEAARAPLLKAYKNGTMERRCAVCGNLFMPSHPSQTICSPACKKARHRAQAAAYQRAKSIRSRKEKASVEAREEAVATPIPCVYYKHRRWVSIINHQYLGSFDTQHEAAEAVEQYKAQHPEYKPRKRYACKRYAAHEQEPDKTEKEEGGKTNE